jgi:lipopolysaccharide export system permease protein
MMLIGATLGRYLSARFLKTILAVFLTVFVLVYTLDFVELMRRSGDAPKATAAVMAKLALFRTPAVAEQVLPFAVLFGAMATLLSLSRKLELVVARAAGVSAWQFLQPGLFVAGMIGLATITIYNPFSSLLKQKASEIEARTFARNTPNATGKDIWIRQKSLDGQSILRASNAIENTTTLMGISVFLFLPDGSFLERIEAREATLHDGYWSLTEARVLKADEPPEFYADYLLATNLEASQVRQSFMPPESVPFWDLNDVIIRTEKAGLDATRYRLHKDSLLARPLLFIAMVMVAASVSLRFFRMGGVARMVLGGVAAGFMLYVATEVMEDLGASGLVSPALAAWFPALLGTVLGALTLLHQEDG